MEAEKGHLQGLGGSGHPFVGWQTSEGEEREKGHPGQ